MDVSKRYLLSLSSILGNYLHNTILQQLPPKWSDTGLRNDWNKLCLS